MRLTVKNFNKRFLVGTALIVIFSLFCGYLNIGLFFLFGTPLIPILAGLLLVWFSPQSWKHRLAATLLIFPSFTAGFAILYWTLPRAEPETFLIPKDFRGTFVVVFVQGCPAEPIPYSDGRRTYRIPQSGVLLHTGERTFGWMDQRFFSLDEDGNRTEIPVFYYGSFQEERSSWRWRFSNSQLDEETVGIHWAYWRELAFTASNFRELSKETRQEREAKNQSLVKLIDLEAKRLNCITY
jgi:hypothetical protein